MPEIVEGKISHFRLSAYLYEYLPNALNRLAIEGKNKVVVQALYNIFKHHCQFIIERYQPAFAAPGVLPTPIVPCMYR